MEIQKGIVKYKDRNDIVCTYGVTADGKQYYFLGEDGKQLKNGNRIASTALVEAIDPMVKASNIGLVDEAGREVIAFDNKTIKSINDDILLVEKAEPVGESVLAAMNLKSDPTEAARLVSTPAAIKAKLNAKMGVEGRYFFNDQFSEATVCDINGNNLVNDEYFSFIGMANGKLYFSKNTEDSEITEYSMLPPEVQSDITPASDTNIIDVSDVAVSKDVVENALNSESVLSEVVEPIAPVVEEGVNSVNEEVETEENVSIEENTEVQNTTQDTNEEAVEDNNLQEVTEAEEVINQFEDVMAENFEAEVENGELSSEIEAEEYEEYEEDENSQEVETEITDEMEAVGVEVKEDNLVDMNNDSLPVSEIEDAVDNALDLQYVNSSEEVAETEEEQDLDFNAEEMFKDSILKEDKLVDLSEEDEAEDFGAMNVTIDANDSIIADVASSMNSLINQNRKQKATISQYKEELDNLNATKRNMEVRITKLESHSRVLENKIREQEKIIANQARELSEIRPQLEGKDELVKLLADAQVLLGQDSYEYSDDDSYYKKVA